MTDTQTQLINLAGSQAFDRGNAYFLDNRISQFSHIQNNITAVVDGTRPYRVMLTTTPQGLDGYCSCPASNNIEFCKHCVAVALYLYNQELEGHVPPTNLPLQLIDAYLLTLSSDELRSLLLNAATQHEQTQEALLMKAQLAQGQLSLKKLKKMITAGSPAQDVWGYADVTAYYNRFEQVLENIQELADEISPTNLMKLFEHGHQRLTKSYERVDTSGGEYYYSQHLLEEIYKNALQRLPWTVTQRVADLLDRVVAEEYSFFNNYEQNFASLFQSDAWQAFYIEARRRFDELPDLPFGASYEDTRMHIHLAALLRPRYEANEDHNACLALDIKCCTDSHGCYRVAAHYLRLAELQRCDHWLRRGDEAATAPHQINHALHVAFLEASERWTEALTRHKQRFFAQPTEQSLAKLQELAIQANAEAQSTAEVERHLQAQLKSPFQAQTAALLLAELARQQSDMDGAYHYIHDYVTNSNELQKAAKLYAQQPQRACELLSLAMEDEIKTKNKRGYRRAVDVLQEAKPLFEALSSTAFLEQIANLRDQHRAKRNLMKMLDEL